MYFDDIRIEHTYTCRGGKVQVRMIDRRDGAVFVEGFHMRGWVEWEELEGYEQLEMSEEEADGLARLFISNLIEERLSQGPLSPFREDESVLRRALKKFKEGLDGDSSKEEGNWLTRLKVGSEVVVHRTVCNSINDSYPGAIHEILENGDMVVLFRGLFGTFGPDGKKAGDSNLDITYRLAEKTR